MIHLLLGFTLASWSFLVATPFGKSPQLAAVASTFLSIVFAIFALVFSRASTGAAFVFSLLFPPGFYIFAIRAVCGFEAHQITTSVLDPDPDNGLRLLPLIIAAIVRNLPSLYIDVHLIFLRRSMYSSGRGLQCSGRVVCTMLATLQPAHGGLAYGGELR